MSEWHNSFVLLTKPSGTVCWCLNPTRLNQALIEPVHRGPTINYILLKITNVYYMTIIKVSSGYHNLKCDKTSVHLMTFACKSGRYKFTIQSFGVVPVGALFQQKIDEVFMHLLNVLGIADDILIVGYDVEDRDHERTLKQEMQMCHQEKVKLNKWKCHLRCTRKPFSWEGISREGVQLDPKKICALSAISPNNKKELQSV